MIQIITEENDKNTLFKYKPNFLDNYTLNTLTKYLYSVDYQKSVKSNHVHIIKRNTSIEKVIKGMKEKTILVEKYIQGNDYTVALMN